MSTGMGEPLVEAAASDSDLMQAAAVGIIAVDVAGRIVSVNSAASTMLGWFEPELVGRELQEVVKAPGDPEARAFGHAVRRLMHLDDDTFRHRDGTALPVWWASNPLRISGASTVVGAVIVFGDTTVRRARAAAEAAQLAQRSAELASARQDVAQLEWLGQVMHAVSATLDEREGLDRLARLLAESLADVAIASLIGDDGVLRRVCIASDVLGFDAAELAAIPGHFDTESESFRTATSGQTTHLARAQLLDPAKLSDSSRELMRALDAEDVLVVALVARGHTVGTIALVRVGGSPPFNDIERLLAVDVASRAALAVDNARLYHLQSDIARRLQQALLPRLPERLSVQAAVRYTPARNQFDVGGDWYDVFRCPDDGETAVLVVGDVAGHDLQAGTTMSALRNLLRGIAVATEDSPDRVLTAVDDNLNALGILGTATVVLMTVAPQDDGTWVVEWSNAGHMPPLLIGPDRAVEVLSEVHGPLLGTNARSERSRSSRIVPGGSTLVLYTDGLVEVRDENIDLGLARLRQATGAMTADLDDVEKIVDELLDEDHANPEDDTAILVCHLPVRPAAPRS